MENENKDVEVTVKNDNENIHDTEKVSKKEAIKNEIISWIKTIVFAFVFALRFCKYYNTFTQILQTIFL